MTPIQVLNHYAGPPTDKGGRVAIAAKELNITKQAIYKWLRENRVPCDRQAHIQIDTNGKLKADRPKKAKSK